MNYKSGLPTVTANEQFLCCGMCSIFLLIKTFPVLLVMPLTVISFFLKTFRMVVLATPNVCAMSLIDFLYVYSFT